MLGVESVIISKEKRGTGLGRVLMKEAENFAREYYKSRGKTDEMFLYLYTNTAQQFYEKCGYEVCDPPQAFGNVVSNLSTGQLTGLAAMLQKKQQTNATSFQHVGKKSEMWNEVWMRKSI
eukprot:TRINITY_DN11132_c0_g1_i1.p1 TRINITY_DN11132_c0_g1~~TRINITY_DN11132_c0_g1_i1.p1  ORF type:complete len:120 (-),score=20.27 TRINITY_DN11132_c0_g1_i1:2-361(-)